MINSRLQVVVEKELRFYELIFMNDFQYFPLFRGQWGEKILKVYRT